MVLGSHDFITYHYQIENFEDGEAATLDLSKRSSKCTHTIIQQGFSHLVDRYGIICGCISQSSYNAPKLLLIVLRRRPQSLHLVSVPLM